jgi:Zn-dependent M28 family amino/carboxypeptidase
MVSKENEMKRNRRRRRRVVVVLGLIAVVAAVVLAYGWGGNFGRDRMPAAYEHLEALQEVADEHGDRAAGSPGYEAAAEYVEAQLAEAGYESTRQYFTVEYRGEEFETFNIIAETAGSEENVVMLGAHLDGVPGSPAINDNGSGVAALLETATALSQQEDITHKVRFAWWGAEELPKSYGSRHYVRDLAENDPEALEAIAAYLNVDMVASPNHVIGVYDAGHADPRLDVPDGSEQIMKVFTDYFDSRDQPWVGTTWDMNSDQVAFLRQEVAVGGLFTGDTGQKTPQQARLFGGAAGQPADPHYDTPRDDLDNVDPAALGIMTDALTHAATRLAQDRTALD